MVIPYELAAHPKEMNSRAKQGRKTGSRLCEEDRPPVTSEEL